MRRSRAIWALLVASISLLVIASLVTVRTGSAPDPQIAPDLGFRVPVAVATPPGAAATGPSEFITPGDEPVHVTIDSIGVSSPIDPVGLDSAGAVRIPEDITRIGWYRFGVLPGSGTGSAVLVGHRDGRDQGHGAFYELSGLGIEDRIIVTTLSGRRLPYEVVARETIPKTKLPIDELFSDRGQARLTLISCAGYYSRDNGGYQSNIVITAVPAKAAERAVTPMTRRS